MIVILLNKDINLALYKTIMEGLKMLLKAYTKFVFLENSIIAIKTNKPLWKKLDNETKSKIKFILKGVKMINKDIKNILFPIAKGLKE